MKRSNLIQQTLVHFLVTIAVIALVALGLPAAANASSNPVAESLPMVGTAAHGHTYPGATVPFGMVQLSPDTDTQGWDWCSGYHYSESTIQGFSHTHLSGSRRTMFGHGTVLDCEDRDPVAN